MGSAARLVASPRTEKAATPQERRGLQPFFQKLCETHLFAEITRIVRRLANDPPSSQRPWMNTLVGVESHAYQRFWRNGVDCLREMHSCSNPCRLCSNHTKQQLANCKSSASMVFSNCHQCRYLFGRTCSGVRGRPPATLSCRSVWRVKALRRLIIESPWCTSANGDGLSISSKYRWAFLAIRLAATT